MEKAAEAALAGSDRAGRCDLLDVLIERQVSLNAAERERLSSCESQGAAVTTAAVAVLALAATGLSTVLSGANVIVLGAAGLILVLSVICGTIGRAPSPGPLNKQSGWEGDERLLGEIESSDRSLGKIASTADPIAVRETVLDNWERRTELAKRRADVKSEWTLVALLGLQSAIIIGASSLLPFVGL